MSRDYSSLGLNDRLQAINSPISTQGTIQEPEVFMAPDIASPPGARTFGTTSLPGTAVVDRAGLSGTASFRMLFDEDASNPISGTTYTLIGGADRAFTLSRATPGIVFYGGYGTVPSGTMTVRLWGSSSSGTSFSGPPLLYNSGSAQNASAAIPINFLSGNNTYQLHASLSGAGTADFGVGAGITLYIITFGV